MSNTRSVLFIKPDFWVVLDTLTANDGLQHAYDTMFHFDCKAAATGLRLVTQNPGEPNLTVAARPDAGLSLKIVESKENPVQGWLPARGNHVRPAPAGIYSAHPREY